ncbi:MAG: methyltransferase family protein [Candidatus Binatia bacterium]
MTWSAVYVVLVLALFVRFDDGTAAARRARAPEAGEWPRLVAVHHGLFYALLLVVAPAEALLVGGASQGRLAGAVAFAMGVALYRRGAVVLGTALSPLVSPHPQGRLVTDGPYRFVRHPIYLGQLLIAVGAPLTLGCRYALAVSCAAAVVLFVRARFEEDALARAYPEYRGYAARTWRLVPFVF